MRSFIGRRLIQFVPTFLGVTLLTFGLLMLAPGEQADMAGGTVRSVAAQESLEQWRHLRGMDDPMLAQYGRWLWSLVRLDFGRSLYNERPVFELIMEALPRTMLLTVLALLLTYAIAVPLGIHSAVRRGSRSDRIVSGSLFLLYSLPSFWVAFILIFLLGGVGFLDLFPITGLRSDHMEEAGLVARTLDLGWHLVLPVLCLTYPSLARTSRFQRSAMLDIVRQDFIRTARAKGLSERAVIFKHALKSSLLPVLTLMSMDLPWIVGGSVVIERIFTIHGMGMLTFLAIERRDYPVIMGVTTLVAILTMLAVLLADIAYAWADPRIRHERSSW
jgi:peptide/nickel transport system permease protein